MHTRCMVGPMMKLLAGTSFYGFAVTFGRLENCLDEVSKQYNRKRLVVWTFGRT